MQQLLTEPRNHYSNSRRPLEVFRPITSLNRPEQEEYLKNSHLQGLIKHGQYRKIRVIIEFTHLQYA